MRTLCLALLLPVQAWAVPLTLSHQGRLLDSAGDPLEGAIPVTFSLYGAATGGTAVWTESHTPTFVHGYYTATLGSVTALDLDDFAVPLFLGLVVDGTALPDRLALNSVPNALRAGAVEGGAVDAAEVRVDGDVVIQSDGTIDFSHLTGLPPLLSDFDCDDEQILQHDATGWTCADLTIDASDLLGGTLPISVLPIGDGPDSVAAGEHTHDANDVVTGTVSVLRLPVGTENTQVARGDHTHVASGIVGGTLSIDRLPVGALSTQVARGDHAHGAASITTGTLSIDRLPVGTLGTEVARGDHTHAAAAIVSGTVDVARLPVGPGATQVAAGDHTHGALGAVTFGQDVTAVAGPLQIGGSTAPCDEQHLGWLRVVTSPAVALELCDGEAWTQLGAAPGSSPTSAGESCLDLYDLGVRVDGPYWIDPTGGAQTAPFQAWCDMTTDGGGWTLVHKTNKSGDGDRTDTGFNVAALTNPAVDTVAVMHRTTLNAIGGTFRLQTTDGKKLFWEGADYYTTGNHSPLGDPRASLTWGTWYETPLTSQNASGHSICIGAGATTAQEHICVRRWCCGEPSQGLWYNGGAWSPGAYYSGTGWVR